MLADAQVLENILTQVHQLSPESRLRLIQRVTATLIPFPQQESQPLQFGKYKGNRMSSLEDFAIAEWHPTDSELNGK
jgi:hypothetical protein